MHKGIKPSYRDELESLGNIILNMINIFIGIIMLSKKVM